jgi:integrase
MKITLKKRKLLDGRETLYLDYYKDGKRRYEFLKLYIKRGDSNNKEVLLLAEKIKSQRMIELSNDEYDQISSNKKRASFKKYFENYAKTKPKWSNYQATLKHLKKFEPNDIIFKQINKAWLNDFAEYLSKDSKLKKNTAFLYFRKTKEVLYKASQQGFIKVDIIRQAKPPQKEYVERSYLELFEIEKLLNTECDRPDIKKAFLFSCFTGLRQVDVRNLKWKNIIDNTIQIEQQKTKSKVKIPIGQTALNILKSGNVYHLPENKIFNINNDRTKINRTLVRWFKKAEVNKKAYYHLSRHTFATLNLTSGNDIYTVSKLLGHKSLKTTEIYAKIIDEKKKQAVDNLPALEVNL